MIRPKKRDDQRLRESIRLTLARANRSEFHLWSDEEIEARIDHEILGLDKRREAAKAKTRQMQRDLLDHGCHAGRTRGDAARAANRSSGRRREAAERAITAAGPNGLTRHECADAIGCPVHGVTAAIIALREAGRIIETDRKRITRYGKAAAVLVSASAVGGCARG